MNKEKLQVGDVFPFVFQGKSGAYIVVSICEHNGETLYWCTTQNDKGVWEYSHVFAYTNSGHLFKHI